MFLRGDVREADGAVIAATSEAACRERLAAARSANFSIASQGHDARLAVVRRTAVAFDGDRPVPAVALPADPKVLVSDTGEITWNRETPGAAYLAVNTPNTKLFTGFPAGRTIDLGGVTLTVGATRLDWATVSLVSRNGTGFGAAGAPASILLAATGDAGNAGRVVKDLGDRRITLTDRGHAPMMVEGIPATVTLVADSSRITCHALAPDGHRTKPVPVEKGEGNTARIRIGPEYKTVWYELDIR
jgi:hypothetical protein